MESADKSLPAMAPEPVKDVGNLAEDDDGGAKDHPLPEEGCRPNHPNGRRSIKPSISLDRPDGPLARIRRTDLDLTPGRSIDRSELGGGCRSRHRTRSRDRGPDGGAGGAGGGS